jgi:ribosomal protein S18 acetylase RimI-like enzyme
MQFPGAYDHIILLDGKPIGRVLLNGISLLPGQANTNTHSNGSIHLVDIALLPEYHCQGTGTRVLRDLLHAAARGKCRVTLQVQAGSPAARLYQRLGFSLTGQDAMYSQMTWTPVEG